MANLLPEVIDLNVGGMHVTTTRSTLTKYPDSMLAAMFSGRHVINKDKDGRFMIDCDGKIFRHILEFLRFEKLPPVDVSEAVYMYSEYFQLVELSKSLCTFQPVSRLLHLSTLNERNTINHMMSDIVIECLSKSMAQKNDTLFITVTYIGCACCELKAFRREIELQEIKPMKWLGACLPSTIHFSDLPVPGFSKDEMFFLTANQLQARGYGPNVLYSIETLPRYRHLLGCFLICKDNALSKLHNMSVKFKCLLEDSCECKKPIVSWNQKTSSNKHQN